LRLQAGIQNNPDAPQLYVDLANLLSNDGKNTDADGVLDRLRKQMPKSPERKRPSAPARTFLFFPHFLIAWDPQGERHRRVVEGFHGVTAFFFPAASNWPSLFRKEHAVLMPQKSKDLKLFLCKERETLDVTPSKVLP
jgi:hypothetical protein